MKTAHDIGAGKTQGNNQSQLVTAFSQSLQDLALRPMSSLATFPTSTSPTPAKATLQLRGSHCNRHRSLASFKGPVSRFGYPMSLLTSPASA